MDIKQAHLAEDWTYDRPLLAVRVSPDGLQAITSSEDSSLQRWTLATGEKVVLKGHESWVHALRYTSDGKQVVSGGCDGRLIWWAITDPEPPAMRTIDAHAGWIRAIDISPDGSRLASVGNDLMIRLWDMSTGEKVAEWGGHAKHIYSVLFHPDGQHLITGDLGGSIHWWNLASKQSEAACGGSTGGFLLFFNADSEKDIHRFKLPALARDMDWHPATERVLTVHHDHHLRVTNLFPKVTA